MCKRWIFFCREEINLDDKICKVFSCLKHLFPLSNCFSLYLPVATKMQNTHLHKLKHTLFAVTPTNLNFVIILRNRITNYLRKYENFRATLSFYVAEKQSLFTCWVNTFPVAKLSGCRSCSQNISMCANPYKEQTACSETRAVLAAHIEKNTSFAYFPSIFVLRRLADCYAAGVFTGETWWGKSKQNCATCGRQTDSIK